jgi:signal transduction histidine kinase/ActR/RegA family two-component response regulator
VLARLGRDAAVLTQLLQRAGLTATPADDWKALWASLPGSMGMVLMTEESASPRQLAELSQFLAEQPPWSELPVLVLLSARRSASTPMRPELAELLSRPGVLVQRRPVPSITLLSTIRAALRARARQHAVRGLLMRERASREQALAAMRVKDEFLAVVSHELRTPVSAILMWGHLLTDRTMKPEQVNTGIASILRSASTQQQLIEDLLDVGRMLNGTLRIAPELQTLGPLIEAAAATVRPAAEAKGVQLTVHTQHDHRVFAVDALRMQQVFWNLLGNAVKFTPRGGSVTASLEAHPEYALVVVRDTGQGIASELLPEVFDRFRQGEASTTRRQGGLGLGLAIARQLVELHGGEVDAASAGLGRGASFTVRIPLPGQRRTKAVPSTSIAGAPRTLADLRVLLVEDDPEMRMALSWMLESAGATVLAVDCVDAALAALRSAEPDDGVHVIISDLGLPERDGFDLLRTLRSAEANAGSSSLPAIAISAQQDTSHQERARSSGYQRFVAKPITPSSLLSAIESVLTPDDE